MSAYSRKLLAASPSNWAPPHDCRPAMRTELNRIMPPRAGQRDGTRLWIEWLIDRLDPDGIMPRRFNRRYLIARSGISRATFTRRIAAAEATGLFERDHRCREVAPRDYRQVLIITAAARFRQLTAPNPAAAAKKAADQRNAQGESPTTHKRVTEGLYGFRSVDELQAVTRERAKIQDDLDRAARAEVALADRHWPRLAKSRSDVPDCRPAAAPWVRPLCGLCDTRHNWHERCHNDPRLLAAVADERPY